MSHPKVRSPGHCLVLAAFLLAATLPLACASTTAVAADMAAKGAGNPGLSMGEDAMPVLTLAAAPAPRISPRRSIRELIWAQPMPRKSTTMVPDRPTSRLLSAVVKSAAIGKAERSSQDWKAISTTSTVLRHSSTIPTCFPSGRSLHRRAIADHQLSGHRASAHRHSRRSQFCLRHRRRGIHDGELHRELQRRERPAGSWHCRRFEISHRLDRGRRLGICADRSLADPVRISVRGVPENERVRRDHRTRCRNQYAAAAPATSSCRSLAPA